jgi:hypothetical protein
VKKQYLTDIVQWIRFHNLATIVKQRRLKRCADCRCAVLSRYVRTLQGHQQVVEVLRSEHIVEVTSTKDNYVHGSQRDLKPRMTVPTAPLVGLMIVPPYGRECPQGSETSRLPHFLDNRLTDGAGHPFTPQEDTWYSFLLDA